MFYVDSPSMFDGTHRELAPLVRSEHVVVHRNFVQLRRAASCCRMPSLSIVRGLHSFFEAEWEDLQPTEQFDSTGIARFVLQESGVYYCSIGGETTQSDEFDVIFFHHALSGCTVVLSEDDYMFPARALFPGQSRSMIDELSEPPSDASRAEVQEAIRCAYNGMLCITAESMSLDKDLRFGEDWSGEEEAICRVLDDECSPLEAVNDMYFYIEIDSMFGSSIYRMQWRDVGNLEVPQLPRSKYCGVLTRSVTYMPMLGGSGLRSLGFEES